MPLTFPTQAEQTSAEADRLGSIAKALRALGFQPERGAEFTGERIYTFDDDTRLVTKGHGKGYRKWTELP